MKDEHWWRKVDWLKAVSEGVLTLAGPLGAPLKALLSIREDLNRHVNEAVGTVYENSASASVVADALKAQCPDAEPLLPKMVEFAVYAGSQIPMDGSNGSPEEFTKRLQELFGRLRTRVGTPRFSAELRRTLAEYFSDPLDIRMLLNDAEINPGNVNWSGNPEQIWFSVLQGLKGKPPIRILLLLYEAHKLKPDVNNFRIWLS